MRRYQLIPSFAVQTLLITSTSPLPSGTVGVSYSFTFNAIGGVAPYTWTETGGLPSGLSLAPSGTLSGTPSSTFSGSFVVKVTDNVGSQFSATFSLNIASSTLTITTSSPLPAATQSNAYSFTMAATGGTPPYTWSLTSQTGSNGWSVSSGGLVTGTPSTVETDTLLIKVVDSVTTPSSANFNLTVNASVASSFIAVSAAGRWVNGAGTVFMPRGGNFDGPSGQMVGGWPSNAWGSLAGFGGPPWPTYQTWKPNIVRITMNVACFMNLNMGVLTGGSPAAAAWTASNVPGDPNLLFRGQIIDAVNRARAAGCFIIFNSHWAAPSFTLGGVTKYMGAWDQPAFMDYDTCFPYWCAGVGQGPIDATGAASTGLVAWLQQHFGPGGDNYNPAFGGSSGINDIAFELFNEPYFDQMSANFNTQNQGAGSTQTQLQVMLNGGWCSSYRNQFDNATGRGGIGCPNAYCGAVVTGNSNITNVDTFGFNAWWRVAGYQQVLTGIRALGATNVIIVNPRSFSSKQSDVPSIYPADTLSPPQVGTAMHAYQSGSTIYPGTGDAGSGGPTWNQFLLANAAGTSGIGHAIPTIITEYGNSSSFGGSGPGAAYPDLYMSNMQTFFDAQTLGSVGSVPWEWDNPAAFGFAGTSVWIENILGAPVSFTASYAAGGVGGTRTGTMTVTAGSGLQVGMVCTGGSIDRAYIMAQLTGAAGGPGTYQMSFSGTQGSTTFTGNMWLPQNAQGKSDNAWMAAHAPP